MAQLGVTMTYGDNNEVEVHAVHRGVFRSTEVAIKLVPALGDAAAERAFRAEADMLARLRAGNG